MKTKFFLLVAVAMISCGFLTAQQYETETELIQSAVGQAKKDFETQFVNVPDDKSDQYWTYYNDYEAERKEYARDRVNLLQDYVQAYNDSNGDMSKHDIRSMEKKYSSLNRKGEKLRQKYFNKISQHVSPQTAVQFIVVEEYLDTAVQNQIYANLPF